MDELFSTTSNYRWIFILSMHNEGNWVLTKGQEISEWNCCVSNCPKNNEKRSIISCLASKSDHTVVIR